MAKAECKGNFSGSAVKRISQTNPIYRGRSLSDRRTSHSPSPTFSDTNYSRTAGHSWEKLIPAATGHEEVTLVPLNHFCIFPRIQWTLEQEPFPQTRTGCCCIGFAFVVLKPKPLLFSRHVPPNSMRSFPFKYSFSRSFMPCSILIDTGPH